jgi:hypothetical protein
VIEHFKTKTSASGETVRIIYTGLPNQLQIQVVRPEKTVGNNEGLLVLKRLDSLQRQVDELNRKNDSLDLPIKRLIETQGNWRFVRQITLDEWANIHDKPQRLERNDHVHGGMIATDVDLLSNRFLDPDRKRRWESAFYDAYGVSFTKISGKKSHPRTINSSKQKSLCLTPPCVGRSR